MDVAAPQQAASSLAQSGQDTATAVRAGCSNLASLASLDASASQLAASGGGRAQQAGERKSRRCGLAGGRCVDPRRMRPGAAAGRPCIKMLQPPS